MVHYGVASDMNTPNPDPGEEYPHVNTQLFGIIDPVPNHGVMAEKMGAPFNAPASRSAADDGWVRRGLHQCVRREAGPPAHPRRIRADHDRLHSRADAGLLGLARGFAAFDHWFCEVPSQTFTNRSFFHAGTASGYVMNLLPPESFPAHNTAETIFNRLDANGLTWRVYCDPPATSRSPV